MNVDRDVVSQLIRPELTIHSYFIWVLTNTEKETNRCSHFDWSGMWIHLVVWLLLSCLFYLCLVTFPDELLLRLSCSWYNDATLANRYVMYSTLLLSANALEDEMTKNILLVLLQKNSSSGGRTTAAPGLKASTCLPSTFSNWKGDSRLNPPFPLPCFCSSADAHFS